MRNEYRFAVQHALTEDPDAFVSVWLTDGERIIGTPLLETDDVLLVEEGTETCGGDPITEVHLIPWAAIARASVVRTACEGCLAETTAVELPPQSMN